MGRLSGPLPDPAADAGWSDAPARKGFFTDTSICIGCKACEVACKEWNGVPEDGLNLLGFLLRQHRRARRVDVAARRVHRATGDQARRAVPRRLECCCVASRCAISRPDHDGRAGHADRRAPG